MNYLLALDPGTFQTGVCVFKDGRVDAAGVDFNDDVLARVEGLGMFQNVVIEMMSSYGMPCGQEVMETLVWIGRFMQASRGQTYRLYRKDVKLHLCQSARAKDANIWAAIVDRYGGKEKAVGRKKTPGPLYHVKSHARAALAVGLCFLDGVRSDL